MTEGNLSDHDLLAEVFDRDDWLASQERCGGVPAISHRTTQSPKLAVAVAKGSSVAPSAGIDDQRDKDLVLQ